MQATNRDDKRSQHCSCWQQAAWELCPALQSPFLAGLHVQ